MGEGSWFDRRTLGRSRLREAVSSRDSCTPQARLGHCPGARDAAEGDSPHGKQGAEASRASFFLRRAEGGESRRSGEQAAASSRRGEASVVFRGRCWEARACRVADGSAECGEASSHRLGVPHGAGAVVECVAVCVGLEGVAADCVGVVIDCIVCTTDYCIVCTTDYCIVYTTDYCIVYTTDHCIVYTANTPCLWLTSANSTRLRHASTNATRLRGLASSRASDAVYRQSRAAGVHLVECSRNPARSRDEQPGNPAGSPAGVLHVTRRPLDFNALWLA